MQSNDGFGWDKSFESVPRNYHVAIAIPREGKGVLVKRAQNGDFSLPTFAFEPDNISVTQKARKELINLGLRVDATSLREFDTLYQPSFDGEQLVSVDVFASFFVEGVNQRSVLDSTREFGVVTADNVTSFPIVGLKLSEEREFSAQARILFDALSVVGGPFYSESESMERIDQIGHELSEDGFFPVCNGVYLGIYREKKCWYYHRIDPFQPEGRHVGPLDSLVGS
jgi:hypothetical protein